MGKIKKIIAIAASTMMITSSIFTGCSNSKEAISKDGGAPTKLTWYAIGEEPKDLDKVMGEVNKYLEEKINALMKQPQLHELYKINFIKAYSETSKNEEQLL